MKIHIENDNKEDKQSFTAVCHFLHAFGMYNFDCKIRGYGATEKEARANLGFAIKDLEYDLKELKKSKK